MTHLVIYIPITLLAISGVLSDLRMKRIERRIAVLEKRSITVEHIDAALREWCDSMGRTQG